MVGDATDVRACDALSKDLGVKDNFLQRIEFLETDGTVGN